MEMTQGAEEPIQTFLARVKPIARNCGFKRTCKSRTCQRPVDYTDEIVLMQMLTGMADNDIKRKVLGHVCVLYGILVGLPRAELAACEPQCLILHSLPKNQR